MCSMVLQVIGVRDWGQSDIVQSVLKSVSMFSFTTLVRRDELVWMPVHTMLIAGRMLGCGVCNQVHVSPNLYIFLVQCDLVHNRIWARSFLCEYVNLLRCLQAVWNWLFKVENLHLSINVWRHYRRSAFSSNKSAFSLKLSVLCLLYVIHGTLGLSF